jgi:hypothetical protein
MGDKLVVYTHARTHTYLFLEKFKELGLVYNYGSQKMWKIQNQKKQP